MQRTLASGDQVVQQRNISRKVKTMNMDVT